MKTKTKTQENKNAHLTPKDILDSITRPISKEKISDASPVSNARYNKKGEIDNKLNDTETVAIKQVLRNKNTSCKVKCRRGGRFFNPLESFDIKQKDKTTNENMFKFRDVSEKSFNNYVKFLQTGYDSLLVQSERECN